MSGPAISLLSWAILWLLAGSSAIASDGVIEINQACALNGCDSGDSPGFPVFITQPGSYKLTGNLDLSGFPNTSGIQIAAPFVSLDLNGFSITGPTVCTGSGPTLSCGGVTDGAGVLVQTEGKMAEIRNGVVRNMGADGIWGRTGGISIRNVRAMHNARDGIRSDFNAIVTDSTAVENGEDGIDIEYGSVVRGNMALGNGDDGIEVDGTGSVVESSTASDNGNRGFHLAHSVTFGRNDSRENVNRDSCGGGICSDRRRFYFTQSTHDGDEALDACAAGFHMGTLHEVLSPQDHAYDYILGLTDGDSGQFAPSNKAVWARTGSPTNQNDNCFSWTSDSQDHDGIHAFLTNPVYFESPALMSAPWITGPTACSGLRSVLCVED